MRVRLPLVVARIRWTAYLGIWLARFLGLVRRALSGEVRLGLIPTAILAAVLYRFGQPWWLALVGFAGVMILIWGYRARKRLVIEPVSDFTTRPEPAEKPGGKDKKQKDKAPDAGGLATRLAAELTHLTDVHRQVDERRVITTSVESGRAVQPYAKVDDVSAFLDDATSAEGRVTFGPFQVPLGLILGLLGKIVRGPRIVASLHKESGNRQLIAMMSGGGTQSRTWSVDDARPGPSASEGPRQLDDMLHELACRIFADLSAGGLRWDATLHFSRGLSAYRDALESTGNRVLNLKSAEREFLEARAADKSHGLASYNLGVVYTEFGENTRSKTIQKDRASAATFAFQNAITEDPERWEPYYARAEQAHRSGQHPSVVRYCDRVIALAPKTARSYDLKAMSLTALGNRKAARHCHKLAVYNAWRWLMVYEMTYAGRREPKVDDMKAATQQCLLRLGEARLDRASQHSIVRGWYLRRSARASFRQARWINKHAVLPYLALAELYESARKINDAEKALEAAAERDPLNLSIRGSLAVAKARIGKTDGARTECTRVLDSPWMALNRFPRAVEKVAEAYDILVEPARAKHVRGLSAFSNEVKELREKADRDGLDVLRSKYTAEYEAWNRGYVDYVVGLVCMKSAKTGQPPPDPRTAAERFKRAMEEFDHDHGQEIRTLGLHAQRARALAHAGDKRGALVEAEKGIALDPLNSFERRILGGIYYTNLGAYDVACSSFRQALLGSNSDPEIHRKIGLCHLKLGDERHKLSDRRRELEHAVAHFEHSLELFSETEEDDDLDETRFSAHFNLALAELRLGAYGDAIAHFSVAQAFEDARLIATVKLAEAYLRIGAFGRAVELADHVIAETEHFQPWSATYGETIDYVMSVAGIHLRACQCRALACAERGSELEAELERLQDLEPRLNRLSARERPGLEAAWLDCMGWILTKHAVPFDAIPLLERSISLDATADSHYHMACACHRLAETAAPEERARLGRRTRASIHNSAALDLEQRYVALSAKNLDLLEWHDVRLVVDSERLASDG